MGMADVFFAPMRQSFFYYSDAGKFYLAHGLRQLTRDVKSDVRILNFRSDVTFVLPRKHRMTFVEGHYATENFIIKRNDE